LLNSQVPDKQKAHLDGGVHLVDDALNEMQRQRLHEQELHAIHGQLRALRYGLQWDCPALRGQPARCMSSMEFALQEVHESHTTVHGISDLAKSPDAQSLHAYPDAMKMRAHVERAACRCLGLQRP
jgi:hypothetical protein